MLGNTVLGFRNTTSTSTSTRERREAPIEGSAFFPTLRDSFEVTDKKAINQVFDEIWGKDESNNYQESNESTFKEKIRQFRDKCTNKELFDQGFSFKIAKEKTAMGLDTQQSTVSISLFDTHIATVTLNGKLNLESDFFLKQSEDCYSINPDQFKLEILPNEVLVGILGHVDPKSLIEVAKVSQRFKALAGICLNEMNKEVVLTNQIVDDDTKFKSFLTYLQSEGCKIEKLDIENLKLNENQLNQLMEALAKNKSITKLHLIHPLLKDIHLNQISEMSQLTSLRFSLGDKRVRERFKLSIAAFDKLSNLTNLEELHLDNNKLEPREIQELANKLADLGKLTKLDLSYNYIGAKGASYLANLTNLTTLNLSGNDIEDEGAMHLSNLTNLTTLNLSGNDIEDEGARHLSNLINLTTLDLSGNDIGTEGARHLTKLINLTTLNLSHNVIRDEGARHLANLTNLTTLNLSYNGIRAEGARHLANLTNLTTLDLGNNYIGDKGARHLSNLTNLTTLNLSHNVIRDEGARHLAESLVNLTTLNLSGNDIGTEGARHLTKLINLTTLNLMLNRIDTEGARHLANLINLTTLNLSSNVIRDEGARHLANITNLTTLDLGHNYISAEGARHLANITNLTTLPERW